MADTRLVDVIVPDQFTSYVVQNTAEKTALLQSGVLAKNALIADQLTAGAESFTVPFWRDLGNEEANIANDDPAVKSTPNKITAGKQKVRKAFLHNSWSAMNLASELSGDNALKRIQERVTAYWDRQLQRRLIASLNGILAWNVANTGTVGSAGDMVLDVSSWGGSAAMFSAAAVIDAAGTMGDSMDNLVAIALHSDIYRQALKNDLIETIPDSKGGTLKTFRGLAVIVDDGLPVSDTDVYTSVLFGAGAVGYAVTPPRVAEGTAVEVIESAGRGGGQQILHSRVNLAVHLSGFSWLEADVADESPSIAELADPANWSRIVERKSINVAFLQTK